jgi:hypothetical protein
VSSDAEKEKKKQGYLLTGEENTIEKIKYYQKLKQHVSRLPLQRFPSTSSVSKTCWQARIGTPKKKGLVTSSALDRKIMV